MAFGFVRKDKIQAEIEINGKPVKNTIKDLKKSYRQLNREVENLTDGTDEFNKKAKELAKVKKNLDDARGSIRKFQGPQTLVGKGFSLLKGTIGKLIGPIGAIFAIGKVIDYARAIYSVTQQYQGLREEVNRSTGLVGDQLAKATAQVSALGKTFRQETQSIIESTKAASKAFGVDFIEALDVVEKGLLAVGPERGGEFLEQIREYSVQAEDLGLTFEETATIIAKSQIDGNFNDKAIDSVKEFNLRIRDLSTSQQEILEQDFGKEFSDNLVEGIESGEITTKEALQKISGGLNELDQQGKNIKPVIANLFGAPGEDVGDDFILSLQNIDSEMGSLIDTSNIYVQRQLEQLELEKELAAEQEELSFRLEGLGSWFTRVSTIIQSKFWGALNGIIRFFKFIPERWGIVTTQLGEGINFLIRSFEALLNKIVGFLDVFDLFGDIELPKIELDQTAAERQKALQDAIAADRDSFAKEQERRVLENTTNLAKKDRLLKLREQSKTQAAKRKQYEAEAEKMAKLQADAQKKIDDILLSLQPEGEEKDISRLQLQATRQIEAAKGSAEQIATQKRLIEEKLAQDIEAIRAKYEAIRIQREAEEDKREIDAEKKRYEEKLKRIEEQKAKEELAATQGTIDNIIGGGDSGEAEQGLRNNLLNIQQKFLLDKLNLQKQFGVDTLEVEQEIADSQLAIEQKKIEDIENLNNNNMGEIIKIATETATVLNAVLDFQSQRNQQVTEERLEGIEAAKEKEIAAAGDNAAAKERIEEKYAAKVEAVQTQAAKKEKDIAVKRAFIDAALAILKASASAAFPANLPAISQALIINGLQIASISSQKFKDGGLLPDDSRFGISSVGQVARNRGGIPRGSSHAQGGISLIDNQTGFHLGEIEGGEPILSKEVYKANKPLIDRLLLSGKTGKKPIFATGGILPGGGSVARPSDDAVTSAGSTQMQSAILEELKLNRQAIQNLRLYVNIGEPEVDQISDIQTDISTRNAINREI